MIDISQTLGGIIGGTFVPIYVAIYLLYLLNGRRTRPSTTHIAALALGISLFFFVDIILDSTELGVNSGFSGGATQAGLLLAFATGTLLLNGVEYYMVRPSQKSLGLTSTSTPSTKSSRRILFFIPALVAISLGIHGAGEGSSFAFIASRTVSDSILTAFGGVYPLVSYVLHKFLEATIVGSAYFLYVLSNETYATGKGSRFTEILVLGLLMGIPTALGTLTGYYMPIDPIYFYAFASGATIYVITKVAEPALKENWNPADYEISSKKMFTSLLLLVGFFLLYFVALFHSVL